MSDAILLRLVADRLEASPPADGAQGLVLAAFDSPGALQRALAGETSGPAPVRVRGPAPGIEPPVYLRSVEVEGFRGIGPPALLELTPGPGLTLVVGRNGSGKSSLAEALELLLTGSSRRWAERTKVWQDGWRNLHHGPPRIEARLAVEGHPGGRVVARHWRNGADLAEATLSIDGHTGTLDALGWTRALQSYRPLLSHNELGRILDDGPAKLYDALAGILGLEDLTIAQRTLREARLGVESTRKEAAGEADRLRTVLQGIDDQRAQACATALAARDWNLAEVDAALGSGVVAAEERSVLGTLRALSSLPVVDREAVAAAGARLEAAELAQQRAAQTDAGTARDTARLLEEATRFHAGHAGTTCPVCGTEQVLTHTWRLQTAERIAALRETATALQRVDDDVQAALAAGRRLVSPVPQVFAVAATVGIDTAVVAERWARWAALLSADLRTVTQQLVRLAQALIPEVAAVRAAAAAEVERREDLWRPAARELQAWLPGARRAISERPLLQQLKTAEAWLKAAHDDLRDQRFRPIANAVQENWTQLRQDSNVQLGALRLMGSSTQRRLTLDVSIDGAEGSALAVMSQGELNCLALSLFLPRATMPESPFRFVVIDDPVQAMDPAKVAGLARVLERVARDHQVVVLTHDERLPETVRRLAIAATVIEVARREQSAVSLRVVDDPVLRHIDDAMALAMSSNLPAQAQRVIPGLCRLALEAACQRSVTDRMMREGRTHAEIDATLAIPGALVEWLALLMFNDPGRRAEVVPKLSGAGMDHTAAAVQWANRGTHTAAAGDPKTMVRACERLARRLASLSATAPADPR